MSIGQHTRFSVVGCVYARIARQDRHWLCGIRATCSIIQLPEECSYKTAIGSNPSFTVVLPQPVLHISYSATGVKRPIELHGIDAVVPKTKTKRSECKVS